ncbi:PepSY domain-containing protein [Niallia sp. 03133]|uniref:PepSY domain-containing protein n=1 Tax=Niallia sp. 03133 TaxID=3458060 RepID=UPI004043EE3B
MKNNWRKISIGIAAIVMISVAAFYIGKESSSPLSENSFVNPTTISVAEAKKLAQESTNKNIEEVDLEVNPNGEKIYQVEFQDNVINQDKDDEVYINADTGKITTKKAMKENIKITVEQAKQIALKKAAGTIEEIELDEEAGLYFYDLEVIQKNGKNVGMEISAETGKIIYID